MYRRVPSTIRLLLGALAAALALLASAAPSASAHAYLEASSPAAGVRESSAPAVVSMRFDEPLTRLSTAAIYDAQTDTRVRAAVSIPRPLEMVLRPARKLPRGSYRVEWHSVSAADGHEVDGSFAFGVQAPAIGGAVASTQNPLAGLGWLRVLIRTAMYAALFVFTGALMLRTLLGARGTVLWVLPAAVRDQLGEQEAASIERRERSLVANAGLLAVALAAASALIDTQLAAGNLSPESIHAYLLSNTAGVAQVGLVALLALALTGAVIVARGAGFVAAFALGELALSGHADSASPRALAVAVDWLHLLAGAVWLGGIAVMALLWLPRLRAADRDLRRAVMADLLPRFGRVALPSFLLVSLTGLISAYIQVRHPSLLWDSSYGRALLVKSALVASIALISYTHAFRLRPRLLTAGRHPDATLERRHWRLVGSEPLISVALAASVAVLVSFGTPAQIASAKRALTSQPLAVCNPCVLPLPAPSELSVATHVGSDLVAAWLNWRGGRLEGQVRVLDVSGEPASIPFEIVGATSVSVSCGLGCRGFTMPGSPAVVRVTLNPDRRPQSALLATRWRPAASSLALRILLDAQATMRRLHSVEETETVTSVPGFYGITEARMHAPDRLAYKTYAIHASQPKQPEGEAVEIGANRWVRNAGAPWQRLPTEGMLPFATATWFTWSAYAQTTRLIGIHAHGGHRLASILLMDPGTPVWWTLTIDLTTGEVLGGRLITPGHFETERFSHFNHVPPILAPTGGRR